MKAPAKQYDESLINYYDDELVGHADTVFRFAFALALNAEGAQRLTRRAYQVAAAQVERMGQAEGSAAVAWLLGECWKAHAELKSVKAPDGTTPVVKTLKRMSLDERAALVAVDVAGLSCGEAGKALAMGEHDLRHKLAKARKLLLESGL